MKRKEHWPELLAEFLHERREMPFEWGKNDCCVFSADAVLAMTGVDLMSEFRGKYSSALSAYRTFKNVGGLEAGIAAACERAEFAERQSVFFCQRGDLVIFDQPRHGPVAGICMGSHAFFLQKKGFIEIETALCRRAWSTT